MFGVGALVGGAVVLGLYLKWFPEPAPPAGPVPARAAIATPAADPQPVVVAANSAPPAAATCPTQPLVGASSPGDGQFALQAALSSSSRAEASAFLAVAREAAEQGRPRDAEVALLAACHASEQATGALSAPVAEVKSQVGQEYAAMAARTEDDGFRHALLQRASALLSESAQAYASALGSNASKTRMARDRLEALKDPSALAVKPAPLTIAAPREREPEPTRTAAAREPDTARMGSARASLAERAPARSEDLRQVDQDLDRLYAQARAVSTDPAGLQQRHQQALAQRSACNGDADCMRQWYAQRRKQLFDEF